MPSTPPTSPAASALCQQLADIVRQRFLGEGTGHDWFHIERVRRLALRIADCEGADREIVELGALLHDIADWKFHAGDENEGPRQAALLLQAAGASPQTLAAVCEIVADISFKGAGVATPMRSLEGCCVQDADRLDALGAIGIARCFAYGGHTGRPLHDPAQAPVRHATAAAYKQAKGTSLNHFHEKLYLLEERMNTRQGKAIAAARQQYMREFEARFRAEWDSRDAL